MTSRLRTLARERDLVPQYLQFAVQADWECAVRLGTDASSEEHGAFLQNVDETVACEIFYADCSGAVVFLGLRYANNLRAVGGPREFVRSVIGLAPTLLASRFDLTLRVLGETLNDDPSTYLSGQPDRAELGIIDVWKTMPSVVIAQRGELKSTTGLFTDVLRHQPRLVRNDVNHVAVELAFNHPGHWLGVQVSDRVDGSFVLDSQRLQAIMSSAGWNDGSGDVRRREQPPHVDQVECFLR